MAKLPESAPITALTKKIAKIWEGDWQCKSYEPTVCRTCEQIYRTEMLIKKEVERK